MAWIKWLAGRPLLGVALKAAIATGLAYFIGSRLPAPIDAYNYYAALGAFTVVGLVVVDSIKESLRVFGAVAIGVAVAAVVQALSWTNSLTIGVTVLACVLLAALPFLGEQRTWAPLAALFVLATGGPDPEPMVLGYLVQVPLGAVIGVIVNLVLLAPLADEDLERSTARVLEVMADHMHRFADFLEQEGDREAEEYTQEGREAALGVSDWELTQAQAQLRAAIAEGRKARRANPRARLNPGRDELLLDRAEATSRCAAALSAAAVDLTQAAPGEGSPGRTLRRRAAEALRHTADVFEDPERPRRDPAMVAAAQDRIRALLEQVRSMSSATGLDHILFGALALTIEEILAVFTRQVVGIDDDPPPRG
ncbi:MAG TPA: FUSC family membrane protein [Ornithinicoccus sp.]|nr:FUSC family membrane protein [Ornithinicoccus sp.]